MTGPLGYEAFYGLWLNRHVAQAIGAEATRRGTVAAHTQTPDPLLVEASSELEGDALAAHLKRRQLDALAAEARDRWTRILGGGLAAF